MTKELFFEKWGPSDQKNWGAFEKDLEKVVEKPWESIKTACGEIRIVQLGGPEDEERNCLVWQGGLLLASNLVYGLITVAARDVDMEAFRLLSRVQLHLFDWIDREQAIYDALVREASRQ